MTITETSEITQLGTDSYDLFIDSSDQLRNLREQLGLRKDWHEPDEAEVSVSFANPRYLWDMTQKDLLKARLEIREIKASKFDNAFGDKTEAHIVIRKDGNPVAKINLANLLALACEAGK